MISKLLNPSKEASKEFERLGIKTHDLHGNLMPLADILEQFAPIAQDSGKMFELFGDRGAIVATKLSMSTDQLREFTTMLDNSGGTAQKIADVEMATLEGQLLIIQSQIERLAIEFGDALIPALQEVSSQIQKLLEWFIALSPATKETIAKVFALTAAFLGVVGPMMLLIGFLPSIVNGLLAVKAAFVFAATTAAPFVATLIAALPMIALVSAALLGLGAIIVGVNELSKTTTQDMKLMWGQLADELNQAFGDGVGDASHVQPRHP